MEMSTVLKLPTYKQKLECFGGLLVRQCTLIMQLHYLHVKQFFMSNSSILPRQCNFGSLVNFWQDSSILEYQCTLGCFKQIYCNLMCTLLPVPVLVDVLVHISLCQFSGCGSLPTNQRANIEEASLYYCEHYTTFFILL